MQHTGIVKFYDGKVNRFGFILDDAGGPDVFVHENTLRRAGIDDLAPGQCVHFTVEGDKKGNRPRVVEIELVETVVADSDRS